MFAVGPEPSTKAYDVKESVKLVWEYEKSKKYLPRFKPTPPETTVWDLSIPSKASFVGSPIAA
jgi:hypothetical protein